MNQSTLMQLKIIVERAVRPVQASTFCKRKMREELLAHVSAAFDEEFAQLGDEHAAIERTGLRFGSPAEVTRQLQESVPASDGIRRFWEGPPTEPARRAAWRIAWITAALALVVFARALFAAGSVSAWPSVALLVLLNAAVDLPVYLFGLTVLTDRMEQALNGPAEHCRLKLALIGAGSWLMMMLWIMGLSWSTWTGDWDYLTAFLVGVWLTPAAILIPYALAQSAVLRQRYHQQWANLSIGPVS